jgi:hypothetical protein
MGKTTFWNIMLVLALVSALGAYLSLTRTEASIAAARDEASLRVVAPPAGEWINLEHDGCGSELRLRFGNDVVISARGESKPFARKAVYRVAPDGRLRLSFEMEMKGERHAVSIIYDRAPDKLTPRAVKMDGGEFRNELPESFRRNFTYLKCGGAT